MEEEGRADDVLPRAKERAHLVHAGQSRCIDDAVRVAGEDRLRVARGEDAGGRSAAELARILSVLLLGVHEDARQLQRGMHQDRLERLAPDRAGRPLDHAIGSAHAGPPLRHGAAAAA
jgi:hypothetical protein